ncbi:MAG: HRDC domain-containing protein, partial [Anaerolineae bacterium]|nr:HRDC domain-containing protein [Anaerolineae bacterium]
MINLPTAICIDSNEALSEVVTDLLIETLIGIDTESNSLHAYKERVCLIQLSSRSVDYIIDPLLITDMQPLGMLLAAPTIEKIFHASEYDVMCLKRDFGFQIVNLFDTMIAARICGYRQVGLNNLLALHFGIDVDKSHQRDNWGERPLPEDSLRYAQMDTHYLPALHDLLYNELVERGHIDEALETFQEMGETIPPHDGRNFDPDGYWKIGQPNRLSSSEMGILRELYYLRETIAHDHDLPPFRIFSNQAMVDVAKRMPYSPRDLARIHNLPPAQVRRYGEQILEAVKRGREISLPQAPFYRPPPADISDRYTALHTWRKNRAIQRGVESDVIVSRQTLWSLAE